MRTAPSSGPATATVLVSAAAYLPETPNEAIRGLRYDEKPYWDVERARIGNSREIPVEIVVNGQVAAAKEVRHAGDDRAGA